MIGSTGSVSVDDGPTLIAGLNWIGDSVMALPALAAYRRRYPRRQLAVLVKPGLQPLWSMVEEVDAVLALRPGLGGAWSAARAIRRLRSPLAFVLPHSFRSALPPFLARVPARIGPPGHGRDWMLTRVVPPPSDPERRHQAYAYLELLAPGETLDVACTARLRIPASARADAEAWLSGGDGPRICLMPGAARGPSKRWPEAHFVEAGKRLQAGLDARIVMMGGTADVPVCTRIATAIGGDVVQLAGRTSLPGWAAGLARCDLVVANDSGGMHLATAVGTPVVALFGMTDPTRTGPLGRATVLQHATVVDRDIPRESEEARFQLASIKPREVYQAAASLLGDGGPDAEDKQ